MSDIKLPTIDDLIVIPKDKTMPAIILNAEVKTWREILENKPESLNKFPEDNKDDKRVVIKYEVKLLDDKSHISEDNLVYYENPTTGTYLGQFIQKYGSWETGTEIKVLFDKESKPKILL